jgi:hypothetical protein
MAMSKKKSGALESEAPIPGPDTFDFEAYISGLSTFPSFKHVAYLDQASGMALASAAEEYEALAKRGREILRRQRAIGEVSVRSLVDQEEDELASELAEIQEKTSRLEEQISSLEERVKKSAMTFSFQVGTPDKLNSIIRRAQRESVERYRSIADEDERDALIQRHVMAAQLAEFCTEVVLPDGPVHGPPSVDGFHKLFDSLIASEAIRLMNAHTKHLDSSTSWADRLDAGFPGGVPHVAEESVGSPSDPDRKSLGGAPADATDRGGI